MVQSLFEFVFGRIRETQTWPELRRCQRVMAWCLPSQVLRRAGPLVRWPAGPLARWPVAFGPPACHVSMLAT